VKLVFQTFGSLTSLIGWIFIAGNWPSHILSRSGDAERLSNLAVHAKHLGEDIKESPRGGPCGQVQ